VELIVIAAVKIYRREVVQQIELVRLGKFVQDQIHAVLARHPLNVINLGFVQEFLNPISQTRLPAKS
jgi:hypothetical protein